MLEAQKVEPVGPLPQIHDPSLVGMDLQLEGLRRSLKPPQGLLRGRFGSTQYDRIVRVLDEGAEVACLLWAERVDGVAVDVGPLLREVSGPRGWLT
jgi:hypothetical protein